MAAAPFAVATLTGLLPFTPMWVTRWPVQLHPNGYFPLGLILGEYLASPGVYGPYGINHTDGTQVPKGILEYPCVTDANGIITMPQATGSNVPFGNVTTMFVGGVFAAADLVGLDANAVSVLGRLIQGTVSQGILRLTA